LNIATVSKVKKLLKPIHSSASKHANVKVNRFPAIQVSAKAFRRNANYNFQKDAPSFDSYSKINFATQIEKSIIQKGTVVKCRDSLICTR
jgi:hypothetical protein